MKLRRWEILFRLIKCCLNLIGSSNVNSFIHYQSYFTLCTNIIIQLKIRTTQGHIQVENVTNKNSEYRWKCTGSYEKSVYTVLSFSKIS